MIYCEALWFTHCYLHSDDCITMELLNTPAINSLLPMLQRTRLMKRQSSILVKECPPNLSNQP